MKNHFNLIFAFFLIGFISSCSGQTLKSTDNTSEDLENSYPLYIGMPDQIKSEDTSPGWSLDGQKILLTGVVYKPDGKTPAPNTLLYYYQTGPNGRYTHKPKEKRSMTPNGLGQTHGYIRGWVKTDQNGHYAIRTVRPGTYPSRAEAAHVHITVKESDLKEPYYIDDFVFDNDIMLTTEKRVDMENRGGSGILRLVQKDNLHIGERDIILGLNIPDYVGFKMADLQSGNQIGEDVFSFTPQHAWGPDKGTKTCPICKYGWYHGILFYVGNNPQWDEIKQWLKFFEEESIKRAQYLKAYFVYGNSLDFNEKHRIKELADIGRELQLEKVALTFLPSFLDHKSDVYLNNIDQNVGSTIILYKRARIIDKYINLLPNEENFNLVHNRLDQTINQFFALPAIRK